MLKSLVEKLSDENISDSKENEKYIPFWVFLIRNMSSINCINYENTNNPFNLEITNEIRNKIEDIINNGKDKKLDDSWLNLVLDTIPNQIEMINIRQFYSFFNHLFDKLNADGIIKTKILTLLKNYYLELLNESFQGTINELLTENIKESNNNILKLIYSPKKFIKKEIIKDYSDKSKNLFLEDKYKDLEENLKKLIRNIPKYIEQIKKNVKKIEDINKEEKEKEEIDKIIYEIKRTIKKYNSKLEGLKNQSKKGQPDDIKINPDSIIELEKAEKKLKKYNKILEKEYEIDSVFYTKIPYKKDRKNIYLSINIQNGNKNILINNKENKSYLYLKINKITKDFKKKISVTNSNSLIDNFLDFEKAESKKMQKFKELQDEKIFDTIRTNFINITNPKVSFRGKTFEEFSSQIIELKDLLSTINTQINSLKKGLLENTDLNVLKNDLDNKIKDLNNNFDLNENNKNDTNLDDFNEISEIKSSFEKYLISIQKEFNALYDDFNKKLGNIPTNLSDQLNDIFIDNLNMPLLEGGKSHDVYYDYLDVNSPLLSMPTISKKDGILKCNYKKISFQKGPFCPELYSNPIILKIVSLVDEDIEAEIKELKYEQNKIVEEENEDEENENEENENEDEKNEEKGEKNGEKKIKIERNEKKDDKKEIEIQNKEKKIEIKKIPTIYRENTDSFEYMKVKKSFQSKELIQIEIYIPNNKQKGKIENQIIKRKLILSAGKSNCELEIEMKILTVPIELLLSCENYKLEFLNQNYYLKAYQLLSNENLIFTIQNYIKGDIYEIQTRIESLEENTSKQPTIISKGNSVTINMPKIKNDEVKRINCKIECYIGKNYIIPIIIDSVLMPINYSFQVYDFLSHDFISNKLELLLPTKNYSNNKYKFIKYLPNDIIEINLYFLITVPYHNKKIHGLIKTEHNNYEKNKDIIWFEFEQKEIVIEGERKEINCKIKVDCGNILYDKIGKIICEFEGINQEIEILKKDFNCHWHSINFNEIDIFKYDYINNSENKIKIKNDFTKNGIYICPFGFWNFEMINYEKENHYYKVDPIPQNEERYFITQEGEISLVTDKEEDYYKRNGFLWLNKTYYYPLLCICGNQWYPLIAEYEEDLFETQENIESLERQYHSGYNGFKDYLSKYYSKTYDKKYLIENQNIYNKQKFLSNILEEMKKNKVLDTLHRFEKFKKDYFSFSYLAFLIFEKTEKTLNSFKNYFPESIKSSIKKEIDDILFLNNKLYSKYYNYNNYNNYNQKDWDALNKNKLVLIKKIFKIFKSKIDEIRNHFNYINITEINENIINKKIEELKNKFYSYDTNSSKKITIDSIKKISQNIEKISQDILKSEKEQKEKENNNNKNIESIIGDKLLITDEYVKSVDINTEQIASNNVSDINNKSDSIDEIEIKDISKPQIYSIKSLMEYFGSCILLTQMLPAFIRYSFIKQEQTQITKSKKILSDLINLYENIKNSNFSLISQRTEEYQKSFLNMLSKLQKSGVTFSKDIIALIKEKGSNDNNMIQDFIILPEKDIFKIRTNSFEYESNEKNLNANNSITKKYTKIFPKSGIKTIQESLVMNLEYEQLGKGEQKNIQRKKSSDSENYKNRKSNIHNYPQPSSNISQEIQKVFIVLEEDPIDNKDLLQNLKKHLLDKKQPKIGIVQKKDEDMKPELGKTGIIFEKENFDIEKEINRVIYKMKNINKKKLKLDEVTEREGKLVKLFYSDKLKELLKESIKIDENSNIHKLLESSTFLSDRIFSFISNLNLIEEIPYKNLEVNILLDCARTIGDIEKLYVMLQVCSLTTVLYSLEIPYLISVVGDSGFKVVLKELDEEHSIENLQKALDCIFIKRSDTNIASCIKTAIDKFKI